MAIVHPYLSIITFNVNGLNSPNKKYRMAECIKKQYPTICCLQVTHFSLKNTHRLRVKEWKKTFQVSGNQKKKNEG